MSPEALALPAPENWRAFFRRVALNRRPGFGFHVQIPVPRIGPKIGPVIGDGIDKPSFSLLGRGRIRELHGTIVPMHRTTFQPGPSKWPHLRRSFTMVVTWLMLVALQQVNAADSPGTTPIETVYVYTCRANGLAGQQYHRRDCRYLYGIVTPMKLRDAGKSHAPCSACRPPAANPNVAAAKPTTFRAGNPIDMYSPSVGTNPGELRQIAQPAKRKSSSVDQSTSKQARVSTVDASRSDINVSSLAKGTRRTIVMFTSPG